MRSSRLVAESLRVLAMPGTITLPAVRHIGEAAFQRALARAWQPSRVQGPAPSCLYPAQHDSWRRAVAAMRIFGGAILAEPVGSGKSWIALAVAAEWGRKVAVIGPAAMRQQWMAVAARQGLPIQWHSHELASRGTPPAGASEFVIIDEAHRFRHLETRRVHTIAPWLIGRPSLLLTATPIVNRRADLISLLRLILPDDALLLDGLPSLRALVDAKLPPPALRRVVIRSGTTSTPVEIRQRRLSASPGERQRGVAIATSTTQLQLGDDAGVRALVLSVLLEAGASSDAAWQAALRRYRALLLQSRDAGGISRAALHRFAGKALDQLQLWSLLPAADSVGAPPLRDLSLVEQLLSIPPRDSAWLDLLTRTLSDNLVTICFTRHRATALATLRHLGDATAWVTGDSAGIGPHRLQRDQVLSAFGPTRGDWRLFRRVPTVLVTTEVVSEGLDLQGASRVVHLDLPWHASRLEQRTGRVARIGQQAGSVEVIERAPPPALERLLGMRRRVRSKGRLAAAWLEGLSGVATVAPVALVALESADRVGIVAFDQMGRAVPGPYQTSLHAMGRAVPGLREASVQALAWRALQACAPIGVSRPRLQGRLIALARSARERRDTAQMQRLDTLLQVAGRPGPLGLEQFLTSLADAGDDVLLATDLPAPRPRGPVTIAWMALRPCRRR